MARLALIRICGVRMTEARRRCTDALATADLLPVFAIWGLGLCAADVFAMADARDFTRPAIRPDANDQPKA